MITSHSLEKQANSLAAYLPSGRLFLSAVKSGKNMRKFLLGMSGELQRAEDFMKSYQDEYDPRTTTLFIEEWESALGIPDDCFSGMGTIEERRRDVLLKLASLGVQTDQDFIDLAALFGFDITITTATGLGFPLTFPFILIGQAQARFIMIVNFTVEQGSLFPFTFPFVFGNADLDIMKCLFNKLKPANVQIIYNEV
jgi:uncharacterized protein YmfQ (DUF2313 family)